MNSFLRAFQQVRKQAGFGQKDFPEIVERSTLSRFESGKAGLNVNKWYALLERMGVSLTDLQIAIHEQKTDGGKLVIPVYEWRDVIKSRKKPVDHIFYEKGAGKYAFSVKVKDESMIRSESAFPVGAYLIVEPTSTAENGDLVLICEGKETYFRRLVAGLGMPDNEGFKIIESPTIIGRVVGATWTV